MSRVEKFLIVILILFGVLAWAPSANGLDRPQRKLVVRVSPVYPELARRQKIIGTVRLELVVAPNGGVKVTKVIGGHPLLVGAAVDAVRKWRYEPAAAETVVLVQFDFSE